MNELNIQKVKEEIGGAFNRLNQLEVSYDRWLCSMFVEQLQSGIFTESVATEEELNTALKIHRNSDNVICFSDSQFLFESVDKGGFEKTRVKPIVAPPELKQKILICVETESRHYDTKLYLVISVIDTAPLHQALLERARPVPLINF